MLLEEITESRAEAGKVKDEPGNILCQQAMRCRYVKRAKNLLKGFSLANSGTMWAVKYITVTDNNLEYNKNLESTVKYRQMGAKEKLLVTESQSIITEGMIELENHECIILVLVLTSSWKLQSPNISPWDAE